MRTFVRFLVALGIFLLFGVCFGAACADELHPAAPGRSAGRPGGPVPFTTLAQAGVPGQTGGEVRQVVRDATAWSQVWAGLQAGSALPATPPEVDFGTDMVIVAAMATQPCVSQVTIRAIHRSAKGLRVDLREEPPAANCRCIVSQRPLHAVRLPRSEGAVEFSVTSKPRAC